MSRHHPNDTRLADFAAGTLDEGRSLVVATHLAMCAHCREFVAALEETGGQLLDRVEPVAMAEGAAALALSRLDAARPIERKTPALQAIWAPEHNALLGYGLGPHSKGASHARKSVDRTGKTG